MIKKILMGVGALVILPALFFGKDASSYFRTAKNNMRDAVKQEIPAEFEVDRVKDMVENLVPDIQKCMHVIAERSRRCESARDSVCLSDLHIRRSCSRLVASLREVQSRQRSPRTRP